MTQSYPNIQASDAISASRPNILARDDAVKSAFSGTTFPTTDLLVGMLAYRTDQEKLYQLKSTGPSVWTEIADLTQTYLSKEDADGLYSALAHTHTGLVNDPTIAAIAAMSATGLIEVTDHGEGTANVNGVTITSFGKSLIDDANNTAARATLGLGSVAVLTAGTGSGQVPTANQVILQGLHTIVVEAIGISPHPINGCGVPQDFNPGAAQTHLATKVVPFDSSTQEAGTFKIKMPKSWNKGALTINIHWTQASSGSGGVVWEIAALAIGDSDTWNVSYGSGQNVADTSLGQNEKHRSGNITITPGGTPADNDEVCFRIARLTANGSDTLAQDALLTAIEISFTVNAGTDA